MLRVTLLKWTGLKYTNIHIHVSIRVHNCVNIFNAERQINNTKTTLTPTSSPCIKKLNCVNTFHAKKNTKKTLTPPVTHLANAVNQPGGTQ